MGRVNVVRPDGTAVSVEEGQVAALERLGYRREAAPEAEARAREKETEAFYDTGGQKLKAFGEGVAGGLTLGLADLVLDDIDTREREAYLPGWTLAGQVTGAVAPALLSGGSGAVGTAARATPAAKAVLAGERVAARLGGGAVTRGAVSAGVEGAISSAGIEAGRVLTDGRPDTIESFTTEVGLSALFGAGAGAALGGGISGLGQIGKRAEQRLATRLAKAEDAPPWAGDAGETVRAEVGSHLDEAEKSIRRELVAQREAAEGFSKAADDFRVANNPEVKLIGQERARLELLRDASDDGLAKIARDRFDPEEFAAMAPKAQEKAIRRQVAAMRAEAGEDAFKALDERLAEAMSGNQSVVDDILEAKPGQTADTAAGRTPPPSVELEQKAIQAGSKALNLEFKLHRMDAVRDALSPQRLAELTPQELVEAIETAKDVLSKVDNVSVAGVRSSYEKFLEASGVPPTAGLLPADIAKAVGVPPRLFQTLDDGDVPFLAAWAHMRPSPGAPKSVRLPKAAQTISPQAEHESRAVRVAGKALRYLGGRAAKSALGGGFGSYMLGWQAVDAAWSGRLGAMMRGAKAHVAERIDRSLARMARLEKAKPPAAAVGVAVSRLTPEQYAEASGEVHTMAGAGGREALYMATTHLRSVDPDLADKVIEDGMRRAQYLSKILPKPPPSGLFPNTRWTPSPVDLAKVAQSVRIAEDPATAVELMGEGRLTPQAAECFRETSPALFEKVAMSLVAYASEHPDASPVVKRQISMMLGVPADTLQLYTAQLQAHFGPEPPEPGPAQTAKPAPSMPTQAQAITER